MSSIKCLLLLSAMVCIQVVLVHAEDAQTDVIAMGKTVSENMLKYRETLQQTQDEVTKKSTIVAGQNKFTILRPEGTRTYYVYVPEAYLNTTGSVAVMLTFHGLGDNCLDFSEATGFKPYAEERNFLFVYPCSTTGLLGNAWNAGMCCLYGSSVDDVEFARLIVQEVKQNFRVDSSRVYVSGFSNGGFMAEVLACQAPDYFAAIASVSGVVEMLPGNAGGLQACTNALNNFTVRSSVVNIHGTLDFVVPWTGDAILGFPSVPDDITAWAERNQCAGNPVQTFSNGTFSNQIYEKCANNTVVEVVRNDGGGHEWPITHHFDTTEFICNFFNL